jgi:hypothetical protein
VLLSKPEVARFIQDNFVPCWESVRPVPKVTVDFGEGRKLQRTLSGNTVISICLPDGRVVDAFPGVYTPEDFLPQVRETLTMLRQAAREADDGAGVSARVLEWHRLRLTLGDQTGGIQAYASKMAVESPLLRAMRLYPPSSGDVQGAWEASQAVSDPLTNPKAALAAVSARIEDVSKKPASPEELQRRFGRGQDLTPEQLGDLALKQDSQTSVVLIRPAVHLLFAGYGSLPDARTCRDAVYKEIIHTPVDDPYLGLTTALVPGTPPGE